MFISHLECWLPFNVKKEEERRLASGPRVEHHHGSQPNLMSNAGFPSREKQETERHLVPVPGSFSVKLPNVLILTLVPGAHASISSCLSYFAHDTSVNVRRLYRLLRRGLHPDLAEGDSQMVPTAASASNTSRGLGTLLASSD